MGGGHQQVSTASLVMQRQCKTCEVAKQFIAGGSEASWAFGTHFGGVLLDLAMYVVVLELLVVVLGQVELENQPSTMTWQWYVSFWGIQPGQAGGGGLGHLRGLLDHCLEFLVEQNCSVM
jgi:hypothetical protein